VPEFRGIPSEDRPSLFRREPIQIILYNIDCSFVGSRHETHGPVGPDHQPVSAEAGKSDIKIPVDIVGFPVLPICFGNQA
jgi:hypothetical protein